MEGKKTSLESKTKCNLLVIWQKLERREGSGLKIEMKNYSLVLHCSIPVRAFLCWGLSLSWLCSWKAARSSGELMSPCPAVLNQGLDRSWCINTSASLHSRWKNIWGVCVYYTVFCSSSERLTSSCPQW